ncbi:hypothetical protein MACK_000074 [Theileria orientalis]|uniref:CS domain-containing protein n=1 Tax=Theileria orientalis TaxID=68886 RepID=A0A976MAV9_THEOR|nr:hypothetical protein MACK_000074 [Theileria orientalis]
MGHDHGSDGPGSGNNESLSHGLQINSIYWETGHRTYLPFWANLLKKFTPKIIDDKLRKLLGETNPVSHEPFVFYGDSAYFRSYYGDPDVSVVFPLKNKTNFCFSPTGKSSLSELEHKYDKYGQTKVSKSELVYKEVLRSARELDRQHKSLKSTRLYVNDGKSHLNSENETETLFTEEDLKNINDFVNEIKAGVYGEKYKKEMESLKVENSKEDEVKSVKEILKIRDERLEKTLNEVFDLTELPTEGKEIEWSELEKKISEQGRKEGLNTEELKSMVHSLFRKKGLLKEDFKALKVSGLKLNWRQSPKSLEIWFTVEATTKRKDYEIKFLPSTLTIERKGEVILQKSLFGKVDCEGSFWTMYKNPSNGDKYINISMTKRTPNHEGMWDQPFK